MLTDELRGLVEKNWTVGTSSRRRFTLNAPASLTCSPSRTAPVIGAAWRASSIRRADTTTISDIRASIPMSSVAT